MVKLLTDYQITVGSYVLYTLCVMAWYGGMTLFDDLFILYWPRVSMIAQADDDESGWRMTEGGGCNNQPLMGER